MPNPLGSLCLVLHGHLPYVLHHGDFRYSPHGEVWLYEAAAETYLPLLDVLWDVSSHRARPAVTIGLTPVLLEQLGDEHFKAGFVAYLKDRIAAAQSDRREFEGAGDAQSASLAERYEGSYARCLEAFEGKLGRDIPEAFAAHAAAGNVALLSSAATHAYLPLLLNDQMIHAQLAAGVAATKKHLGISPSGVWLPECAYRPGIDTWLPAVLYSDPRKRQGIEAFLPYFGLNHFFVDTQLFTQAHAAGTVDQGQFQPVVDEVVHWETRRGWRSPLEPVYVSSFADKVAAFARHPYVSEQVWSSFIGYPSAGEYLEFHRKHPGSGLRYHRITDTKVELSQKQPYRPEDTFTRLYQHATHFANTVKAVLKQYHEETGRHGTVVAPFDAELFGHWWREGPNFLRDVLFILSRDAEVELVTTPEALERHPPDKVMRLPEGSWGQHGNHSVWINDKTRWMWEVEYRAEGRFLRLLYALPWRENEQVRQILERAGRELMLLQASDWPFVVHSKGAVDYGIERFGLHATRFDRALDVAESVAAGASPRLSPVQKVQLEEMDLHDTIFPTIDLNWWM